MSMSKLHLEEAIQQASQEWQDAFNDGDAIMQAVPFGIYCGRDTIRIFWRQLIDDGYRELTYLNTHIKVINEQQAYSRLTGA